MRHRWIKKLFGAALLITIVIAGLGQAVHQLWNWLMPRIVSLPAITFWQSVGLLILSWILFGGPRGFGFHGGGGRWRRMTLEQREQFARGMRGRCGQRPRGDDPA